MSEIFGDQYVPKKTGSVITEKPKNFIKSELEKIGSVFDELK